MGGKILGPLIFLGMMLSLTIGKTDGDEDIKVLSSRLADSEFLLYPLFFYPCSFLTLPFFDQALWNNFGRMLKGEIPSLPVVLTGYGQSYTPDHRTNFFLICWRPFYRYQDVWLHQASSNLFFSWEFAIGSRIRYEPRLITSAGIFATRYLLGNPQLHIGYNLYVEGGIGIIYTDFQVEKQGLRVNFNPKLALGINYKTAENTLYFVVFQLFHLSNAGLHEDNRGINAYVFLVGRSF